jgi:hypothetical protein
LLLLLFANLLPLPTGWPKLLPQMVFLLSRKEELDTELWCRQ